MHPKLLEEVIRVCKQRQSEGDCPTTPALSNELLEDAIIELGVRLGVITFVEPK